jgi:hypothetical protein
VRRSGCPAGKPISQAFDVPAGPDEDPIRLALSAIDRVHGDGALPPLTVHLEALAPGQQGYYDPVEVRLAVSPSASRPTLTLIHEIGHVLDHHGLGGAKALASQRHPLLADWRSVTRQTQKHQILRYITQTSWDAVAIATATHLLLDEELWARAFAQYVVVRSKFEALSNQLDETRRPVAGTVYLPRQWDDGDFAPVADSIDRLFRRLGWIT